MNGIVKLMNCPEDAEQYIVARLSNGELWYWGSYEDESEAIEVADEFENGLVVEARYQRYQRGDTYYQILRHL